MKDTDSTKDNVHPETGEILYDEPDWSKFSVREPDWSKYPVGLWGLAGVNQQQVAHYQFKPARRVRIGRGIDKAGFCRLANGDLLVSPFYVDGRRRTPDFSCRIKIYRSGDEGRSWQEVSTEGPNLLGVEPALQALGDGGVLLLTSHPHGFRVYRSDDEGVLWTMTRLGRTYDDEKSHWERGYHTVRNVLEQPDGSLILPMSMDAAEAETTWSRTWLYRSIDGGRTWKLLTSAATRRTAS